MPSTRMPPPRPRDRVRPDPVGALRSGHGPGRGLLSRNRRHAGTSPSPHGPVVAPVLLDLVLDDVGHGSKLAQRPRRRRARAERPKAGLVTGSGLATYATADPVGDVPGIRHHHDMPLTRQD